jgi:hypothetical protein
MAAAARLTEPLQKSVAVFGELAVPGWRPGLPGLTSHRMLSGATATM